MEQDYLTNLVEIEPVSVPDFLLEGVRNKIEMKRIKDKRNTNYALAFAFVLLFANFGILTAYKTKTNKNTASQVINPYSLQESTFIGYE